MIIVGTSIVSDDIRDRRFCCNLTHCKGQCCVEGDYGAPLLDEEIPILEEILPQVKPYMTPQGIAAVEQQGVATLDNAGNPCTPLIDNAACAYIAYGADGCAYCAIEQAAREGKIDFLKPVSCHLYPIRVDDFGEFQAVNYHQWDICRCAFHQGEPLYRYLREPLIRRFGQEWYDELLSQIEQ
ncbi:MAG: DUF3109 family protein [Bacteroidales bacterium]|nr:DUF3109 family protein [Bacteroidales bacterium]